MLMDNKGFNKYVFNQANRPKYISEIQLPKENFSKCNGDLKLYIEGSPSVEDIIGTVVEQFHRMQEEEQIDMNDIALICCSQGSKKVLEEVGKALEIEQDKIPFVAADLGYLAVCCPLFALDYAINHNIIKRNDLIWFWGVGAGIASSMIIFEY